jgi:predicted TIM-barrel fold metal-dependent hydrolase
VFEVPEPEDVPACDTALLFGGEFIVDVHTHHVIPDGPWVRNDPRQAGELRALAPAGCAEAEPLECLNRLSYVEGMFLASDTTVAILSNVPASSPDDDPLPFPQARRTRELVDALTTGGAPRVLLQHIVAPNFGPLEPRLEEMAANAADAPVASFKVYTGYGPDGQGWALDDPALGVPFIEQARRVGVRIVSAHKGLPLYGFDASSNGPRDIGAVAAAYPDMAFVVYHAAWQRDVAEGPYDPGRAALGVNSLVRSLQDHGIAPNANVYAELGTTWRELIRRPTEAAHVLGKLFVHVGAHNVLWGTDAVWTGSPQPQIMAFRVFQITAEFQDRYGYPALTDDLKRDVLGENAARLYGLRGGDLRCAFDSDQLARARDEHPDLAAFRGASAPWIPRGPVTRRDMLTWMARQRHRPW